MSFLGLRWEDIDLGKRILAVNHQLDKVEGEIQFVALKTPKSRRTIRLLRTAAEALKKRRRRQTEERLRLGEVWQDWDLVFCTEIGTPLSESNVRNRSFHPILEKAGLPHISFHDLRHTWATLLLARGVHPKWVQALLGHSRFATTMDTYSHVDLPMMDEVAGNMDSILAASNEERR